MCFRLKLFWELNPNMAYIFWSLNCEKKSKKKVKTPLGVEPKHGLYILEFEVWKEKTKKKVKTPLGVEPKHGLCILEFELWRKTQKKAPQILVRLSKEFWISSRILLPMKLLWFVGFHKACGQTHIVTTMKGGDIAKGQGLWHGYCKTCFFSHLKWWI